MRRALDYGKEHFLMRGTFNYNEKEVLLWERGSNMEKTISMMRRKLDHGKGCSMMRRRFYNDNKSLFWERGLDYGQRSSIRRGELDYGQENSVMSRKLCNDNNDLLWEGSSILEKEAIRTNTVRRGFDYEKGVPTAKVSSIMRRKAMIRRKFCNDKKGLWWEAGFDYRQRSSIMRREYDYGKGSSVMRRTFCNNNNDLLWEGSSILEKEAIRTNTMRRGFDYEKGVPTAKVSSIMRRKVDYGYDKNKVGKGSYKNKYYEKGVQLWERCSNRESKFYHEKEGRLWLWQEEKVLQWQKRSIMRNGVQVWKKKFCYEKRVWLWKRKFCDEKKIL